MSWRTEGGTEPFRGGRYRPITPANFRHSSVWHLLDTETREAVEVVSSVLPFRVNQYVVDELIDWSRVPDDPMFRLTFPQRAMLRESEYRRIADLLGAGGDREALAGAVRTIWHGLNPHPSGQWEHNVPTVGGRRLEGLQHKYRETVLFFPTPGQTCHAYCTYCFRWAQFVDLDGYRFHGSATEELVPYLREHPEVSDLLVTGGDPLIMKTSVLERVLAPVLVPELAHVRNVRIGTKAPAYWPQRFVTDSDADDLLRFFERIVAGGRHLAVMVHFSHPVELSTGIAQEALRRIRATGAEIRMQAPLVRHVNDDVDTWVELCDRGVGLGLVPYYMFVERDTGPHHYFAVPLVRAHALFAEAFRRMSGLARTLRGPVMSTLRGKVRVLGPAVVAGSEVLALDYLQARDPSQVARLFFARPDDRATWFDELRPAFATDRPFFGEPPEGCDDTDEEERGGRSRHLAQR